MKTEYIDTAFGNLISSYAYTIDGLTEEEIEQALREQAKKWGGCIACRYSKGPTEKTTSSSPQSIWIVRSCQVGLRQEGCEMFQRFPA